MKRIPAISARPCPLSLRALVVALTLMIGAAPSVAQPDPAGANHARLIAAIRSGNHESVRTALGKAPLDINSLTGNDQTALTLAIEVGVPIVVRLLLDAGAGLTWEGLPVLYGTQSDRSINPVSDLEPELNDLRLREALDYAAELTHSDPSSHRTEIHRALIAAFNKRIATAESLLEQPAPPLEQAIRSGNREATLALLTDRTPLGQITAALRYARKIGQTEVADAVQPIASREANLYRYQIESNEKLREAAGNNDFQAVHQLLLAGADPSWVAPGSNYSAVETAARHDDIEMLDLLILHGASLELQTDQGNLTDYALVMNSPVAATYLMEKGYWPSEYRIEDAIIRSAAAASVELIDQLRRRGADVRYQPDYGRGDLGTTALMNAAKAGNLSVVNELLRLGVNVNARDYNDHTALSLALSNLHHDVAAVLRTAGADETGVVPPTPLRLILETNDAQAVADYIGSGGDLSKQPQPELAALDFCLTHHHYRSAAALLDADVSLTRAQHGVGYPPRSIHSSLALAIVHANQSEAFHELLGRIIPLDPRLDQPSGDQQSPPIVLAALNGDATAVRLLLEAGAAPHLTDSLGRSALTIAIERDNREITQLIIQHR